MKRVLIDSDVILDFFFDRKPFSNDAAKIFSLCESKFITGYITAVIISNVYYLLRQTAKHETVVEKLYQLMTITELVEMDKKTVLLALSSPFKDFEDALQNYASELSNKIDLIITRNTKDYKNSSLGVMTPESFISMIQS